jgi:hypothetical protein
VAEDPGESAFGAIGVSRNEKYLHQEITVGDFPTRLESLIGGTRGKRFRGVRVRHFEGFRVQGKCCSRNHDLAISDNPIRRGDVEEDTRTCIGDQLFEIFTVVEIAAGGILETPKHDSHMIVC